MKKIIFPLLMLSAFTIAQEKTGINTTNPTQDLDVNGNARIRQMADGSDDSVFTNVVVSDANGNLATVQRADPSVPNATETVFGNTPVETQVMENETFYSIQKSADRGASYYRYMGLSITLPPGSWIIYSGYLINSVKSLDVGSSLWVRGIISSDNIDGNFTPANLANGPLYTSVSLTNDMLCAMANGIWFVNNNTSSNQTYYVKISLQPVGFTSENDTSLKNIGKWGEDYLFAVRIND